MNYLFAVIIGAVIGGAGGYLLRDKHARAMVLAPVLSIAGTLIASVLATLFGDRRDYGWKEISLQVVLALAGVAIVYFMGSRSTTSTTPAAK
jgi:uncharacterized membrane protein YeaQ/YmgE (transglycosylase-associated protein family)